MVRGIRSGLPVTECLEIIAREMPEPLSEEFRRLVDGQKMGITLEQLLTRALDRMPTAEFKFFAIVIQVQQQIGGSLADTLSNLSNVLRERKKMRDKARAMAGEGKASAAIISCIPVAFAIILSFIDPHYMAPFFEHRIGKFLFFGGLTWMGIGVLVMKKMINIRI
jgi:tight adherence protein B